MARPRFPGRLASVQARLRAYLQIGRRVPRLPELPRFEYYFLYPKDEARVLQAISRSPGLSLRAIGRATGLHIGVVRGHVHRLTKQRRIAQRRHGARILAYPRPSAPKDDRRAVAADQELRLEEQRRLLAFIAGRPALTQTDILEATAQWGWARSTTQHRLGRLIKAGLVKSRRRGREKLYRTPG